MTYEKLGWQQVMQRIVRLAEKADMTAGQAADAVLRGDFCGTIFESQMKSLLFLLEGAYQEKINLELLQAFGLRECADDPDEEDTKIRIDPRLVEWYKSLGEK